jgi:aspartyl-tRNA(Asn)/glutamyl-tRNA(Gln) amidotransferase subunit A
VDLGLPEWAHHQLVVTSVYESAAAIARAVSAGEITAGAVIQDHLDAIDRSSGLNAFICVDADGALRAAELLDRRIAAGKRAGPLAGVPVAVKDLIDKAGLTTTCGSSFYRQVAEETAPVLRRLEKAGAIIVGKTGLHEFAFGFSSENPWWGAVRNPWDPSTSPGGSSGGSAVAVAAGMAVVGVGTDTGGSVRAPASLCGVVGLKVTHGRVPLTGVFPVASSLDTVGHNTRTVADAVAAYRVMAGDHPDDPWSAPRRVTLPRGPADLSKLRFAVPLPWVGRPLAPEVREGFRFALESLASAGATVEHVHAPGVGMSALLQPSMYPEVAAVHRAWMQSHPEKYGPEVRDRLQQALATTTDDLLRGLTWRAQLRHAIDRLLVGYDALLTPTTAVLRKEIGVDMVSTENGLHSYLGALSGFTAPVNHSGHPALALPLAAPVAFANDPPPSLQLIGRHWGEHLLLEIGLGIEGAGIAGFRRPAYPTG